VTLSCRVEGRQVALVKRVMVSFDGSSVASLSRSGAAVVLQMERVAHRNHARTLDRLLLARAQDWPANPRWPPSPNWFNATRVSFFPSGQVAVMVTFTGVVGAVADPPPPW
jgi:hypothetical protein